jgi:vacuolar-type H+-ATPase subunit H
MTAFDDILRAETDATEATATAEAEVIAALQSAQTERKTRLAAERTALQSAATEALEAHRVQLKAKTDAIEADTKQQVAAVEQKFAGVTDVLTKEIVADFTAAAK